MARRRGDCGPLILITGASGKIEKHVVREAIRQGFKVRGLTSRPRTGVGAVEGPERRVKDFARTFDNDEDVDGTTSTSRMWPTLTCGW
jgi:nucleoside-diphosphate-sugar epimerase